MVANLVERIPHLGLVMDKITDKDVERALDLWRNVLYIDFLIMWLAFFCKSVGW